MSESTFLIEIQEIEPLTHNVKRFVTSKPDDYNFTPGQATEVSINKPRWKEEKRPFTFTCLPEDDFLEFTIKSYHDHHGVTDAIDDLKVGDELVIGDSWGAISYEGPGYFIAGGAGVTPFISIFKKLEKDSKLDQNALIFSNLTAKDVILEDQWDQWLGNDFISTVTEEDVEGHLHQFIDKSFLKDQIDDFSQHFYVCGPDQMVKDISQALEELGAEPNGIVFEE